MKKVPIEVAQNSHENTCVRVSFSEPPPCNFIKKETVAQVFPCEFCEIHRETPFFMEDLWWLLLQSKKQITDFQKTDFFR